MEKEYRVCTKCEIQHIENCETCFGFGVYAGTDENVPVSAGQALDKNFLHPVLPCQECGSTIKGYESR